MLYPATCVRLRYGCACGWMLSGFSREYGYRRCPLARRLAVLSGSAHRADLPARRLPTPFNGLFRQPAAVSLLRPRVARMCSNGMFTVSSVRVAPCGCPLGPDSP